MRKKFPSNFPCELLFRENAKEESIDVFRICRTGYVEEASFLPTYMDEISNTKEYDPTDIGNYSMSTYHKLSDAKKRFKFIRGKNPPAILAIGYTAPECGPCQRTKERTGTSSSHVDWWIYKDAKPHRFFQQFDT